MSEETLKPGQSIKPIVSLDQVKILVRKLYGFGCFSLVKMQGYDDVNYKVTVRDGVEEYVLKIMNSLDSKNTQIAEAQCGLMIHLSSNGIPCPAPLKNQKGEYYSVEKLESGQHVVRLLDYLPGLILHQVPTTPSLIFEAGKFVARLDRVAKTFNHPGFDRFKSVWLLEEVQNISKFLFALKDVQLKQMVQEVILEFKKRVVPVKDQLEKGVIHGDFNEQNIVVKKSCGVWNIAGILDFGDSHCDYYLFELAIAAAYMMVVSRCIDSAGYVLAGYSTVRKPTVQELSLLKICVAARLCQSLVLGAYSITLDPENSYILSSAPAAWELLHELWPIEEEKLHNRWKELAENYSGL